MSVHTQNKQEFDQSVLSQDLESMLSQRCISFNKTPEGPDHFVTYLSRDLSIKGGGWSLKFGVSRYVFEECIITLESSLHWLFKNTKIITIGATDKKL